MTLLTDHFEAALVKAMPENWNNADARRVIARSLAETVKQTCDGAPFEKPIEVSRYVGTRHADGDITELSVEFCVIPRENPLDMLISTIEINQIDR